MISHSPNRVLAAAGLAWWSLSLVTKQTTITSNINQNVAYRVSSGQRWQQREATAVVQLQQRQQLRQRQTLLINNNTESHPRTGSMHDCCLCCQSSPARPAKVLFDWTRRQRIVGASSRSWCLSHTQLPQLPARAAAICRGHPTGRESLPAGAGCDW